LPLCENTVHFTEKAFMKAKALENQYWSKIVLKLFRFEMFIKHPVDKEVAALSIH
jgi:hypothetical protein